MGKLPHHAIASSLRLERRGEFRQIVTNFSKDFLYFGPLLVRAIESRSALTARG